MERRMLTFGGLRVAGALAVLTAAAVAVAAPAPLAAQSACGNVALRSPYRGEVVQGAVPILGSARIDRFQFYKLEWAPANDPERWSAVSDTVDQPMVNGLLDIWDTVSLPDGAYRLKLTVVNGDYQETCKVVVENVAVANAGTPSATGTATATGTASIEPTTEPTTEPTAAPTAEPTAAAGASDEGPTAVDRSPDAPATGGYQAGGSAPAPTLQPVVMEPLDAPADGGFGLGSLAGAFVIGFAAALGLALVAWYALARS